MKLLQMNLMGLFVKEIIILQKFLTILLYPLTKMQVFVWMKMHKLQLSKTIFQEIVFFKM